MLIALLSFSILNLFAHFDFFKRTIVSFGIERMLGEILAPSCLLEDKFAF